MSAVAEELFSIVEIDGLPYVAIDWLERRIYRAEVRMKRWNQEARRMANRTDREGQALYLAYLGHYLQASYRAEKWKHCRELTRKAINGIQISERLSFGALVKQRRKAAGLVLSALGDLAGVCKKTIRHIENAAHQPSLDTLERIIAVKELNLTWEDVDPALLQDNPTDGRKNRKRRKWSISRTVRERM